MNSLKIALVIRDKPNLKKRDDRAIGLFSYAVPELTWEHITPGKGFKLNRGRLTDYDAIILEDGLFGEFIGDGPPVVGIFWDTNWTERHYLDRLRQAENCDLVLIGQDPLERFKGCGKSIERLSYCVNDKVFKDYKLSKDVDVCFHANLKHSKERAALHIRLSDWCEREGLVYKGRPVRDLTEYAKAFNRSKVSVNLSQVAQNRPHRVFDVMASYGCLLTSPLPAVSGELRQRGKHYLEWGSFENLTLLIQSLLSSGEWRQYTEAGHKLIEEHYTWAVRARELRWKLNIMLGI